MDENRLQVTQGFFAAVIKTGLDNVALSQRVEELEKENLSLKVASRIDYWLDQPYDEGGEREDVERFARELTDFIVSKVKSK